MNYIEIVNITLKNLNKKEKKKCREYEKFLNKMVNERLEQEKVLEKLAEAITMGYPMFLDNEGKITIIK